jgi:hypothetical protein
VQNINYDHKTSSIPKLMMKNHFCFGSIFHFSYHIIQSHGSEHEHGLLWIENAPMYECIQMNKLNNL